MLNRLSINLALGLVVAHKASASRKQLTLTTEELGGDSTEGHKPLFVHLDKNSISPEAIGALTHSSSIDVADAPDSTQFVNLGDFESMMYSTDDILEELVREQNLNLDIIKQDERYYQIEKILQDIADEYENRDDRNQCNRDEYKDNSSWGDYQRSCGKEKKNCCGEGEDYEEYEDEYWKDYNEETNNEEKETDKGEWPADDTKGEPKYVGNDDKLDETVEDKLDEKLDEKLSDKLGEEYDDTKNDFEVPEKKDSEEKDDDKQFFWHDEEDEVPDYNDGEDLLTIKEPQYEETFLGTEISVGKTQESLAPTHAPTTDSNKTQTYLTASSKILDTTVTYSSTHNSTSSSKKTTSESSSYYIATSVYKSTEVNQSARKTSSISAHSSSSSSAKSSTAKQKTTTTSSKRDKKTASSKLKPNWKAQANTSNVTVQGGYDNSSNFLMPTSFLFASLLALLAVIQV